MRLRYLRIISATFFLGACLHAHAGLVGDILLDAQRVREEGQSTSVLTVDNDSMLMTRRDGFYTSGLKFSQEYSLREGKELTSYGWRIGQDLYTALDSKVPPEFISQRDHPYAGWLFAGVFKDLRNTDGSGYRLGLDIGCIGPCAGGEATQKTLHQVLNQPLPQGWDTQVRAEAGAVLYADYVPFRWTITPTIDLSPNIHTRFGNIFTDVGAGVTVRAGQLNTMPDQPTVHGFVRLDARVVGYNATLQGGYFTDDKARGVRPKRIVGEIELGLIWSSEHYAVMASFVRRGNENAELPSAVGSQNFARLQFAYNP